ncbi:peptidoglycan-binding protein [Paractinoplanes rishiriensis]|uniref:Peptidoglycan-binding protein n=1 Tax=Paractinoplanes rishiriensis TaxID=1050105 RepID=A0A919MTE0_9ACTN|nr:peptidoglycan-binding protein [Actinoplanes rishiriensis]GIE94164.1 peptidoglycan-binding protein [Actinoplanes rishiriensis]
MSGRLGRYPVKRVLGAGAVVAVAVAATVWRWPAASQPPAPKPGATATVTKRDLVVTEEVKGDLGYAGQRDLTVHRAGVVTALAAEGATIKSRQILYAVNLEPTVLLTGKVPAYRVLNTDSADGEDVRQLETALKALGHSLTVDDHFSAATADAVEDWEEDLGRAGPDGTVELGDVVFAPGNLRVVSRPAPVGAQVGPAAPVLTVSSAVKVAEVDLEVDKSGLVAAGDAVSVRLPDGRETPGKVAIVGTDAQDNPADPDADPTVTMEVTLTRPADAAAFDSGAVTVTIEQSRDEGVLTVPVIALLALAEGGYAVQAAGQSRLTGVEVGTVTDEFAEVTGVSEGLAVVVPS